MTFEVELYNTTDDFRRVHKRIDFDHPLETITVNTSDDCSIINPELLVNLNATTSGIDRLDFNYARIAYFKNRLYFVTPELSTASRMLLHCYLDVYSSFPIDDVEGLIIRAGNASGRMKDDSIPTVYGDCLIHPYFFPSSPFKWSKKHPENNTKENIYILRTR